MSWFAQVGHVLKKDVRQHRWMIAITLVALAGAVVEAMGWTVAPSSPPLTSLLTVVRTVSGAGVLLMVSSLLVVFLVQGDSPARSDAFWVPRPLSPSAVFAAKVALVGFLAVLLPLTWEVLAIGRHHLWSGRVVDVVIRSFLTQTAVLVAVAVVASLTRDLRTFVVASLVTAFAWVMAVRASQQVVTGSTMGDITTPAQTAAWLVCGLALVAYQYRVRDVRRTLRVFSLPALLAVGLGTTVSEVALPRGAEPATALGARDLRIESISLKSPPTWSGRRDAEARVRVRLVGRHAGYRYAFVWWRLRVRLPDGSETTFPGMSRGRLSSSPASSAGLSWLGRDPTEGSSQTQMSFSVPSSMVPAIRDPRSRFAIEGRLTTDAFVEVGPLPACGSRGRG